MNSCYPYFMTKPLPYGEIAGRNRYVKEDELGFNFDLTVKGDTSFRMCFEGEFANIIFKKKVYRGLLDFVEYEYARKKTSTKEERDKHKLILNSLIGIMKYHNVFLRIAVLEYARMYIESLKDENTIMQTVDSIVSLTPRPDLDIGDNLGQFKLEQVANRLYYRSPNAYQLGDKIVYSGVQYFAKKHVDLFNEISATQEGSLIRGFNFVIDENKEYTKVCEVEYGEITVKQYNFLGELINTFKYKVDN